MADGWARRKRFWAQAAAVQTDAGWGVALDGRAVNTPARVALTAPNAATAQACAAEWAAQDDPFDPATMPITRALNVAIDRVATAHAAVVEEVAGYGDTDLLCYRAQDPPALADRQAAAWDPWLAWARDALDAPLICVAGVMYAPQPPAALAALTAEVARRDAFRLTALHALVTISGSLVLGLAVDAGACDADVAWAACRVDEDWQTERWGKDAEAADAAAKRRAAFLEAARLSALLQASG